MDIATFKNKCKAVKEELDSQKAKFRRLLKEQEPYNKECYQPAFTFFKPKCPVCGELLATELVERRKSPGMALLDYDRDIIYSCPCGYVYAVTE